MGARPKRVTLVADELLGFAGSGGLGTATSFLAIALARAGDAVEVLYAGDAADGRLAPDWAGLYETSGVVVRPLHRTRVRTEPSFFARMLDVEQALASDPPDVVVVQDLAAPAYTALRKRQLGLGLDGTLFVVFCHGTRSWITDVARKPRVLPGALAVSVLEQASVELADVVVSPSEYLLAWMRSERWTLPAQTHTIPYVTRSAATGEPPPRATAGAPIERVAFFGRLEDRKGLRPFLAGLDSLEPELLQAIELELVGRPTPAWSSERVTAALSGETRAALRGVSFAGDLDQAAALAHLSRPGTLAVIPSLEDNSPNAVYECLERGIPFVASRTGGIAELVAADDRERVLFEPTADGVAAALRRALSAGTFAAARFAFEPARTVNAWRDVIALIPSKRAAVPLADEHDWIVLVDRYAEPDDGLVEKLRRAQAASGADIVTCALELDDETQHHFLGDPHGLGLVSNAYGTAALVRRSLVEDDREVRTGEDPAWPLLARLVLAGATIVSVPEALVRSSRRPGDVNRDPVGALAVMQEFERRLPQSAQSLARLATGQAAQEARTRESARRRLPKLLSRR